MTDIKILYDTEELIMMLWLVLKFYALKTKKKHSIILNVTCEFRHHGEITFNSVTKLSVLLMTVKSMHNELSDIY